MNSEHMSMERDEGKGWIAWRGDNVELMKGMPENAVDLTVTSIPFANLLCYSASDHDLGNSVNHAQFFEHFGHHLKQLYRVTKPGRICAVHVMNLPTLKSRDGHVGLIDFRGQTIQAFRGCGWIFSSEVTVWKDPVTAAARSHALGLLYKTIQRDSCMSRMGIPDFVLFFRKPGENRVRVEHTPETFPLSRWQVWAEPVWQDRDFPREDWMREFNMMRAPDGSWVVAHDVWMNINPSDTLQARSVREHDDEAHLAPLQLEVIRRSIAMYSNPGDIVFDPFGGIGSTGVVALEMGRRAALNELKLPYYRQCVANLRAAETQAKQPSMFDLFDQAVGGQ